MTESIGQRLRQARQTKELSLSQVAQETFMREHYLEAMEADQFERIPSIVQARGFLRAYAEYLGLPTRALLDEFEGDARQIPVEDIQLVDQPQEKVVSAAVEPDEPADKIMAELGASLRHQRELLGLTLDDVERHTHLRRHYLEAIEGGRLGDLPSPVQGRGMLHNYAVFLGLDPEPVLLRFADALQARLAVRQAAEGKQPRPLSVNPTPPVRTPKTWRRLLSFETLLVVFVVLFLAGFMTWGAVRIFTMHDDQPPAPTAPSIADVLLVTSTAIVTDTPVPATATILAPLPFIDQPTQAPGTTSQQGGEGIRVYVTVHQRTWVRVLVDGDIEYEGRLLPGSAYQYTGEEGVEILTGNAAGVQIFFNQQDLGLMGAYGEVAYWVFNVNGVHTPTPTVTRTPTVTTRPTNTPRATSSPEG